MVDAVLALCKFLLGLFACRHVPRSTGDTSFLRNTKCDADIREEAYANVVLSSLLFLGSATGHYSQGSRVMLPSNASQRDKFDWLRGVGRFENSISLSLDRLFGLLCGPPSRPSCDLLHRAPLSFNKDSSLQTLWSGLQNSSFLGLSCCQT